MIIEKHKIRLLKEFYDLMANTRTVRFRIVENMFKNHSESSDPDMKIDFEKEQIVSLKNALFSLETIPSEGIKRSLLLDDVKKIEVDLTYEIEELKKDIFYLENGEKKFCGYLENIHSGFTEQVKTGVKKLGSLDFNCFITDRDGTINNYCGRYRSSIQSIYNAVSITRFAKYKTANPIIITSAPLKDPGIVDVSVNPENAIIYAASKGREFIDLNGSRRTYPIEENKQQLINKLNKKLSDLLLNSELEKFTLIGSGLQLKFGQTTIARQDITGAIPDDESDKFLKLVQSIVSDIDPGGNNFKIEDTGLDIEIILTIEDSKLGPKDFDKGDAVRYLATELDLSLPKGPHLICGDTASDIPMIEAAIEQTEDTWTVFVTKDKVLAEKVSATCPNSVIVSEPDMLVGILACLSR
ncbi:MAG: trehalose 6-phosphate synthase [Deltaproteobacteria bacterium]|nr:trehalose 6-phosphate synthase [Deltaproteobacteria bacterium]